jgi:hypothetical protein
MSTQINISKKITVKDEAVLLTSDVNSINFTGTGITATTVGNDVTVTVPGSSGGGLQGFHNIVGPESGNTVTNRFIGITTSYNLYTNNIIRLHPYMSAKTFTTSSISMQILNPQAGALGRILIYSNVNSKPDTKLYESTSLNFSTSGIKTAFTTFTFTQGVVYWIGFQNFLTGTSASIASITNSNLIPFLGTISSNSQYTGYETSAYVFGFAPTTIGAVTPTDFTMPLLLITAV